ASDDPSRPPLPPPPGARRGDRTAPSRHNEADASTATAPPGGPRMRVVMMGTGTFAEPTFEAALAGRHPVVGLVTHPDREVGVERGSTRQPGRGLKAIAQEHGIPVLQPDNVNTDDSVAALRALAPDVLLVAAYGQLLRRKVRESAPHGAVNVHASLLPKYRGAAPVAWAIYHGEMRTGVTLFRITKGMDSSPKLAWDAL